MLLAVALCGVCVQVTAEPLQFRISEGRVENAFYQEGPVAVHVLLDSGVHPRALVAFPAGNSGVGVWFEATDSTVRWTLEDMRGATVVDDAGRALHGIVATASVDATRLVVKDAVLGSVRVLRDYQLGQPYPPQTAARAEVSTDTILWRRHRLDGAPGYRMALVIEQGRIAGQSPLTLVPDRPGQPLRLRIEAYTGETPLTPFAAGELFNADAGSDPRSRQALRFLAYRDKYLAGSWRFDTYFGRDTLLSLRMLMPVLQPDAVEAGLAAVLDRLNANGEVAHEEDIGEFAVLRRRERGEDGDAPLYDYGMVDDDRMLAPVAATYLLDTLDLDRAADRARAEAFLARRTATGEALSSALVRNFAFVTKSARAFASAPEAGHLIAFGEGRSTGQWRDSQEGNAYGRYAYDVNAVWMPAALEAIARFAGSGLLQPYANGGMFDDCKVLARVWAEKAPAMFRVKLDAGAANAAVRAYANGQGIDPTAALDSLPSEGLKFDALALDAQGKPIPVLHSDYGFALLFGNPDPGTLERMVDDMMRPFPAGLMTDVGMLVANPAYADPGVAKLLGRTAYHGTVVWSWQQALLADGLARQLARTDLPAGVRDRLRSAQRRLWRVIDATRDLRTSELWSWSWKDGRYRIEPFGQSGGDADESNAAQLWSTVYLAVKPPVETTDVAESATDHDD
ncbi:hypothetical protein CSC70_03425 [Pseudoxanthomonas kalamensis DSM 18571]|nr:hypothetical protein CSC70_03425 [Pseudoxanthomonas kalamensis DSM 18571]